ncbi:class F sortase [uncultured Arthrobacter sp.]|uniref:class F sortase n=1 Tax=uncultured Arthrobacter sp. TaxID=114050 RepID=UPI0025EC4979|nr:class F sortase [uncultured Arthrobacter sp.]
MAPSAHPDEPSVPAEPDGSGHPQQGRSRRRGILVALLGLAAALVLVLSVILPQLQQGSSAAGDDRPTSTPSPAPSVTSAPASPSAAPAAPPKAPPVKAPAGPAAAAPTHIKVEAAGIDVAVLPLQPTAADVASQSIVPPFTDDGYWLSSYGAPGAGSANTTYITGHSWEGREAPFDRFSTHTEVGDTVTVTTQTGTLRYTVDAITTHDKDTLKTSDIWNIIPNRLVIISCYTEDPWGKNVVVTASPAPPTAG